MPPNQHARSGHTHSRARQPRFDVGNVATQLLQDLHELRIDHALKIGLIRGRFHGHLGHGQTSRRMLRLTMAHNTNPSVDHDCVIGNLASIAPGEARGGNVKVGEAAAVGLDAAVSPNYVL